MAKVSLSILLLLLLSFVSGWNRNNLVSADQKRGLTCRAKPSSDAKTLQENIDFACSHVDCRILQKGCSCFSPDNLINHASIAMNLYYQCQGRNPWNCHFGNSGLVVITDPSYGGCTYE